jgi:hypothetical protein
MSKSRQNAQYAAAMLGCMGELKRVAAAADVYESRDCPGIWVVGSLDASGDGGIYETFFEGPFAEERALEYAEAKYSGLRRRAPRQ